MTEQTSTIRGARLREIREALGLTQRELAERLNGIAQALGLPTRYEMYDISVRENGRKALDPEDYATVRHIDPARWSADWLAFGRELALSKRGTKVADLAGVSKRTG